MDFFITFWQNLKKKNLFAYVTLNLYHICYGFFLKSATYYGFQGEKVTLKL